MQDQRFGQHHHLTTAMPAAVHVPVIREDQQGILRRVQPGGNLAQQGIGAAGGGIPARRVAAALMVPGIIHLVEVDQHQAGITRQHGQGSRHHFRIGNPIIPGGVKGLVRRGTGKQLFKPVVGGNAGSHSGALDGGKDGVLCQRGDIFIIKVESRSAVDFLPGAGEQGGIAGRRVGWGARVHRCRSTLRPQAVEHRHDG